jgi:hypothetical protein
VALLELRSSDTLGSTSFSEHRKRLLAERRRYFGHDICNEAELKHSSRSVASFPAVSTRGRQSEQAEEGENEALLGVSPHPWSRNLVPLREIRIHEQQRLIVESTGSFYPQMCTS